MMLLFSFFFKVGENVECIHVRKSHHASKINIGFPAHFRHLFIQFRPEKLTVLNSKVQSRQIVIHIRFSSIDSAFKFVNCH